MEFKQFTGRVQLPGGQLKGRLVSAARRGAGDGLMG